MKSSISVIIPCAFMAEFVSDAFRSIARQDIGVHEIIVVYPPDDEETVRMCREWSGRLPIEQVVHPLSSPGLARNAGLAAATGDVIVFLDADDVLPAERFGLQMKRLTSPPSVDAVGGLMTKFERLDQESLTPERGSKSEPECGMSPCTWMFRRDLFQAIGGFDPDLRYAEDLDLILRIRDLGIPYTILDVPVLYYRQHDASMMRQNDPRKVRDFWKAAFKSMKRRRAMGLPPATDQLLTASVETAAASSRELRE